MSNQPTPGKDSIEGWSTCDLRDLMEQIAHWKRNWYDLKWIPFGKRGSFWLHDALSNFLIDKVPERRALAALWIWDDVYPEPAEEPDGLEKE